MKSNLVAACCIVALALIVAALLNGGIYQMERGADGTKVWRVNRLTGSVSLCGTTFGGCADFGEVGKMSFGGLIDFTGKPLPPGATLGTPVPKLLNWSQAKILDTPTST